MSRLGLIAVLASLTLAACTTTTPPIATGPIAPPVSPTTPETPGGPVLGFNTLAGWLEEDHLAALDAFRAGCGVAREEDMARVCRLARTDGPRDEWGARLFLEANFRPQAVGDQGLLTAWELAEAGVPGASPDEWHGLLAVSTEAPLFEGMQVPVSPSRLERFEESPLDWFLETIGGSTSTTLMDVGTILHWAMETAESPDADAVWARVEKRWGELLFESPWLAEHHRRQARVLADGIAAYLGDFERSGGVVVGAEKAFELEVDRATVRGTIDRVERAADGSIVLFTEIFEVFFDRFFDEIVQGFIFEIVSFDLDEEAFFQIPCADPFRLKILHDFEGFIHGRAGNVEFLHQSFAQARVGHHIAEIVEVLNDFLGQVML